MRDVIANDAVLACSNAPWRAARGLWPYLVQTTPLEVLLPIVKPCELDKWRKLQETLQWVNKSCLNLLQGRTASQFQM